jgi:hypothetical protein
VRRRRARENPASAGGMLLTLAGFGIVAFSAFELFAGRAPYVAPPTGKARPAPPRPKPALPAAAAAPAAAPAASAPTSSGPQVTPAQVQQAAQAAAPIVSGLENLLSPTPAPAPVPGFADASAQFADASSQFDAASAAYDAGAATT